MNLRFLETFVWVARLRSFRLTAEKLFSTQASISSRIAVLEEDLGVKLFLRDSRGVTLTPEGQRVLEYAEKMVNTMHHMRQSLDRSRAIAGRVRIGAMDSVIHTWLSTVVKRAMQAYPALEIELTADAALNLCDQLQKGYLDVIFQTDLLRLETVRNVELARYPIRWIVATGSARDRPYASLDELAAERVITFVKNSRPHQDILSLFHLNGVASPRINCVNSVAAMTRLIGDGFGIGAVPPALVRKELAEGTLSVVDVENHPPALDIVASWRIGAGLEVNESIVGLATGVVAEFCAEVGEDMAVPVQAPAAAPHAGS
ncbi:putative transcriptional regulator, LysR family [Cupriavidus taiwanensis]|uniref:Transcriptional regulator, LysR family n=1 Tax=Cupriavidus taiwanensis TaxID=164546 RepID=A0A976B0Y3_9BURK|nr:LysR family transcriptional regulator [Cupriavidus taiwanensis]SOZ64644.1 putative transcriptional regulator, LysR family [Cupriavidus taiwanensis]SOZ65554.1 putative transcriptional regulator, LysR family [Cupriavidus taiwanensis]SOZ69213.1 putative transcriptional regulator, LysR family [Cupriavidus taiwanensis]SPA08393.1 putative transcriptional regulator, LysR family [Cupriavidus taiwanensis]